MYMFTIGQPVGALLPGEDISPVLRILELLLPAAPCGGLRPHELRSSLSHIEFCVLAFIPSLSSFLLCSVFSSQLTTFPHVHALAN